MKYIKGITKFSVCDEMTLYNKVSKFHLNCYVQLSLQNMFDIFSCNSIAILFEFWSSILDNEHIEQSSLSIGWIVYNLAHIEYRCE